MGRNVVVDKSDCVGGFVVLVVFIVEKSNVNNFWAFVMGDLVVVVVVVKKCLNGLKGSSVLGMENGSCWLIVWKLKKGLRSIEGAWVVVVVVVVVVVNGSLGSAKRLYDSVLN